MNQDIKDRIEHLKNTIRYHQQKYYVEGINEITDYEYDNLYKELQTLEQQYPEYKTEDSPTNRVAPTIASSLTTQEHFIPMLSIENTYSLKEIEDFVEKVAKDIQEANKARIASSDEKENLKNIVQNNGTPDSKENSDKTAENISTPKHTLTQEEEIFIKKLIFNVLTMSIHGLDIKKIMKNISFYKDTVDLAGLKYEKGKFPAYKKRLQNCLTADYIQEILNQLIRNGQISSMQTGKKRKKILYTAVDLSKKIQEVKDRKVDQNILEELIQDIKKLELLNTEKNETTKLEILQKLEGLKALNAEQEQTETLNAEQEQTETLNADIEKKEETTEKLTTELATTENKDAKNLEFVVEQKIDGIAISLWYYNGYLVKALTRGDGVKGELITTQARTIRSIPLKVQDKDMPAILEVRGEVYLTKQMFNEINKKQEERNKPLFANPRNTAAGTLKLLDANVVSERKLQFFAHSLGFCSFLKSQEDIFNQFTLWNIPAIPYKKVSFFEEIDSCLANWKQNLSLSFENFYIKSNQFQYDFKMDNDFLENVSSNTASETLFDELFDKNLSFKPNSFHEIMIFDHQWNEAALCQGKNNFSQWKKLYQEKIRQDIQSFTSEIQNFIDNSYLDSWEDEEQKNSFTNRILKNIESRYFNDCSFVIYPNIANSTKIHLYYRQGHLEIALDENGIDVYSKIQEIIPNILQNSIYPLIEITGILTNNMQFFADSISFIGFSTTYKESLDYFRSWGFPVNYGEKLAYNAQEVHNICMEWEEKKDTLPFNIDGMVIKLNNLLYREQLGATAHAPRWVRAYKFSPTIVETTLESVTLQVGKGGTITPVANLKPVFLDGSTVKHATLHNFSYVTKIQQYEHIKKFKECIKQESQQSNQSKVQEKQEVTTSLCIGDTVAIIKAGEIIPKVIGINIKKRPKNAQAIIIPEHCPICQHKLINKKSEIACRCVNPNCQGGLQAKINYFCSVMEIEELGESIVENLISSGLVETFSDLYKLSREDLLTLPLIAEKKANLILNSIEKSKSQPLSRVLCALSIPNIGKEWASKIVEKFLNLESLQKASLTEIAQTLQNARQKSNTKHIKEEISMMFYDEIHAIENYDNDNFKEQVKNLDIFKNKELWTQYNQQSGQNFTSEMYMNKILESWTNWEQLREATKEEFADLLEEKKRKETPRAKRAKQRSVVLYNTIRSLEHYDNDHFQEQIKNLEIFKDSYLWSEYSRQIPLRTNRDTYINRILQEFENWEQLKKASKEKLFKILENQITREKQKSNKERAKQRSLILYDTIHAMPNFDNDNFQEQIKNLDIFKNTELWSQQHKKNEKSTTPETYIDRILESFDNWDQLKETTQEDISIILEDQSLIAQEVYHFFHSDYGKNIIESLQHMGLQMFSNHTENKSIQNSFITGKKVIVTGTISGFGREEIQEYLKSLGAIVVSSVSKSTDYIITGEHPGANKLQKASEFNIPILTEQELRTKLIDDGIQMPQTYEIQS